MNSWYDHCAICRRERNYADPLADYFQMVKCSCGKCHQVCTECHEALYRGQIKVVQVKHRRLLLLGACPKDEAARQALRVALELMK